MPDRAHARCRRCARSLRRHRGNGGGLRYGLDIDDPLTLEAEINNIVGVVCNGLFAANRADLVLIAGTGGVRRM